jgi:hypothetical protein
MSYSLQSNGDLIEQKFYPHIVQKGFPTYEVFWQKFVVPLTNRPTDIQFKSDTALTAIGKGHHELCIAQLHYTVLRQLGRTFDMMQGSNFSVDLLALGMSTLVGAQDCAFELLERYRNPSLYGPWADKKRGPGTPDGGREAQNKWKQTNGYPLQDIRDYRNNAVHGRTMPAIALNGQAHTPRIGKELTYFDWRLVTATTTPPIVDFDTPKNIMQDAFKRTVAYFETTWRAILAPYV